LEKFENDLHSFNSSFFTIDLEPAIACDYCDAKELLNEAEILLFAAIKLRELSWVLKM
jgi:hypothetical protein